MQDRVVACRVVCFLGLYPWSGEWLGRWLIVVGGMGTSGCWSALSTLTVSTLCTCSTAGTGMRLKILREHLLSCLGYCLTGMSPCKQQAPYFLYA